MEGQLQCSAEDVSARMMRRARCLHAFRYSTDPRDNVRLLEEEKDQFAARRRKHAPTEFDQGSNDVDRLLRCWRWVALIESLCIEQRGGADDNASAGNPNFANNAGGYDDLPSWPAKGLIDAGVFKLLRMSGRGDPGEYGCNGMDDKSTSDAFLCDVYDGPSRR